MERKFIKTSIKEYLNEHKNENNIKKLTLYLVTFQTSNSTEIIYYGPNEKDAFYKYEMFNDVPKEYFNSSGLYVEILKQTNEYKFIYDINFDESMEDYPIEKFYNDPSVYKLIKEGDLDIIEIKEIESINKKSDDLLIDVDSYFKKKYGNYKYNTIDVYDENDEYKGCIQLRISDHTENIRNIDRYGHCNFYISVVICDYDITRKKFNIINYLERKQNEIELIFSSKDNFNDIIKKIENKIEEYKKILLSQK